MREILRPGSCPTPAPDKFVWPVGSHHAIKHLALQLCLICVNLSLRVRRVFVALFKLTDLLLAGIGLVVKKTLLQLAKTSVVSEWGRASP